MSNISLLSKCGEASTYPFVATSTEPMKYDNVEYSYEDIGGDKMVVQRDYYMGNTLQFSHVIEYDEDGNMIKLSIV